MLDENTAAEIQHDIEMERAQEVLQARIDEEMPRAWEKTVSGDVDSDLSSWFDGGQLVRMLRTIVLFPYTYQSLIGDELDGFERGLHEYAEDMAERWATR